VTLFFLIILKDLQGPFRQIQDVARRVASVMQESKISNIDVDEYVKEFRPELIDVTFAWANVHIFDISLHILNISSEFFSLIYL
jgi:superfamily II RNA helicase